MSLTSAGRVAVPAHTRRWRPGHPLDITGTLRPLRRGPGDPTWRIERGGLWRISTSTEGPVTLLLQRDGDTALATAWGGGAREVLDALPALLGAEDDDTGFTAHHRLIADARRRQPNLRLGATGRVWDVLVPAVLEQKVTTGEAWRSWRELCRRFGETPPGPAPAGMAAPPTPARLRALTDWQWHQAGVDGGRRRALITCATVAHRLERAVELRGVEGRDLLRLVPGIGVWTAAEVAQRAWGDPDAVSVGDYHLAGIIGMSLLGRGIDDEAMLAELAPYAPQRHRAVRYVLLAGGAPPRRGPRFAGRDNRGR